MKKIPKHKNQTLFSIPEPSRLEGLSIVQTARCFTPAVWVVLVGMFINRFGTFVIPFLGLHLRKAGYPESHAGWALGCYGVGHFCSALIGGYMADALGRKRSIITSMLLGAASIWTLSSVSHIALICSCAFLAGLTAEMYRPSASALLADSIPKEHQVTAFAMLRFCINLGWSLGPATGGWLAAHSFEWLFRLDALTCCVFGLIAWIWLPGNEIRHMVWTGFAAIPNRISEQFKITWSNLPFRRLILSNVLIAFVFIQWISTLGVAMEQAGFSTSQYGLVLALNGVMIVLLEIPLSAWTRRYAPITIITIGYALIGSSTLLLALPASLPVYFAGMVIFTLGEMICLPVSMAYISQLAPDHQRGRYMGVNGISWSTAFLFGPSVGMVLCPKFPALFWVGCTAMGFVAIWIISGKETVRQKSTAKSAPMTSTKSLG